MGGTGNRFAGRPHALAAAGKDLYQLHNDGWIWRYTGTHAMAIRAPTGSAWTIIQRPLLSRLLGRTFISCTTTAGSGAIRAPHAMAIRAPAGSAWTIIQRQKPLEAAGMCLSRLRAIHPSLRFASGPHSPNSGSRVQASSARLVEPDGGFSSQPLQIKKATRWGGFLIGGGGGNRTRVRKYSTVSSTYLAMLFSLTWRPSTGGLTTGESPIV